MKMKLSEHFTLAELTQSQTAARAGLKNDPTPEALENLKYLAGRLEAIRKLLGRPMIISSGYRAPAVNRLVGGAANSQHMLGQAADFIAPAYGTPYEVASAIDRSGLKYDQLIHEFGRWVHVSFIRPELGEPRRQALSIFNSKAGYLPGILEKP
jgi:hypothetical protein